MNTNSITLIDYLVQADKETLAKVYAGFCRFAWPEILPQKFKPDWWNGTPSIHGETLKGRKYGFILPVRKHIESKVEKSILLKYSIDRYIFEKESPGPPIIKIRGAGLPDTGSSG